MPPGPDRRAHRRRPQRRRAESRRGGELRIPTLDILSTERNIVGTYPYLAELIVLAQAGRVTLHTQKHPLDKAVDAVHDLDAGKVRGRAVLVP